MQTLVSFMKDYPSECKYTVDHQIIRSSFSFYCLVQHSLHPLAITAYFTHFCAVARGLGLQPLSALGSNRV